MAASAPASACLITFAAHPSIVACRNQISDVIDYAGYLGMTLPEDNQFLWIADEALSAPEPFGWEERLDPKGGVYFFNTTTGMSMQQHPHDQHYQDHFIELKKQERRKQQRKEFARLKKEAEEKGIVRRSLDDDSDSTTIISSNSATNTTTFQSTNH